MHFLHVGNGSHTAVNFDGVLKDNDLAHTTFKYSSGHLCIQKKLINVR